LDQNPSEQRHSCRQLDERQPPSKWSGQAHGEDAEPLDGVDEGASLARLRPASHEKHGRQEQSNARDRNISYVTG